MLRFNPFYVLVVLLGITFLVTASAYGVMAVRGARGLDDPAETTGLLALLQQHGGVTMAVEIGALGVACLAAMATERFFNPVPTPKPHPPVEQ